eukprot:2730234-Amphidinium_carterae.2
MLASKTQEMARANSVGPRQCANLLWAIATLQGLLPELQESVPALLANMEALLSTTQDRRMFKEQEMSNTIWAAATLKLDKAEIEPIVAVVLERMKTSPGKFKEQE